MCVFCGRSRTIRWRGKSISWPAIKCKFHSPVGSCQRTTRQLKSQKANRPKTSRSRSRTRSRSKKTSGFINAKICVKFLGPAFVFRTSIWPGIPNMAITQLLCVCGPGRPTCQDVRWMRASSLTPDSFLYRLENSRQVRENNTWQLCMGFCLLMSTGNIFSL